MGRGVEGFKVAPYIGEVQTSKEIGRSYGKSNYIWLACPECGKERWVMVARPRNREQIPLCCHCSSSRNAKKRIAEHGGMLGPNNPQWKGGRTKLTSGYVEVWIDPSSPFYSMASKRKHSKNSRYIHEHRLVMAQYLGRCLEPWEHVHHKNGIRDDNRIENLYSTTKRVHPQSYSEGYRQGFADGIKVRDKELEQQMKLLRWQVKDLHDQFQLRMKEIR